MPNYPSPILEIVNGSETINLLARGKGWHLTGFRPRTAEVKSGGTWQSSPLSNGRQPVSYRYDNIIDTWTATADGYDEDGLIELAQDLERAGVAALDYWVSDWAATPVYIRARGPKETGTRYAVIHQIRVPEYADQFRQPMFGMGDPTMEGITIIIEHGQWQNVAPGSSECVQVSSTFSWQSGGWGEISSDIDADIFALFKTSSGRLLAGTSYLAQVWYSDDDGDTWDLLATLGISASDAVNDFAETNGYIFAAVSGNASARGVQRSANNGASWSVLSVGIENGYALAAWPGGNVIVCGLVSGVNNVYSSVNSGANWTLRASAGLISRSVIRLASGNFLFGAQSSTIYLSSDYLTLSTVLSGIGEVQKIEQLASGRILVGDDTGTVYSSDNANGDSGSWATIWSGDATTVLDLVQTSSGTIYAGDDGNIWRSDDNGATWSIETSFPSADVNSIAENEAGTVLAGDGSRLIHPLPSTLIGWDASCSNGLYVANKLQITGLTHIKTYDAGGASYGDVYPMTSYPTNLLPATPGDDDAIYFGINTALTDVDSGPFSSLVFDLAEPFVGWTTVAWEYWDGSAWSALTVTDKTLSLLQTGVNSVVWIPPSDWATTTVDGVTGWWVRFRVDTIASSPEPPAQQNRQIYSVINPYAEIAAAQIGGDIPALARIQIENVSDTGGPGGSAPTLYANRIIAGLRSYDRGALFTAFLNASDEQNPVGVTVTAGTDTSFVNAVGAPSGRLAQWSPTGTASWVTICTFSLATTIATQYYGTFRVFLRARQSGGTAGQMQLRLRTSTGSGGISITTEAMEFANTNDFQILDFGQLTIPISAYLKPTELGDTLTIAVQGYTSSTTPDCNMYDLVLIPVDEWAADFTDGENSVDSELGSGNYIDIDSVTYPKRQLRNTVKTSGTGYTKAIWQQVANGPAILQANARQRLWFLSMRTASAGSSDWRSEPDVVHRVQVWSAERYRWARGSR